MSARFKHEFGFENYLDFTVESKFRIALSRFRISSHDLFIERGRYKNLPRNERICKFCNSQSVESEYHFLLVCPYYAELRNKYFKRNYCHWPNLNKFDSLMMTNSKQITLNLSKCIYHASR